MPVIQQLYKSLRSFLHKTKLDNRKFYELQKGVINHEKNIQVVGIIKKVSKF
jgi:hypothetical protein